MKSADSPTTYCMWFRLFILSPNFFPILKLAKCIFHSGVELDISYAEDKQKQKTKKTKGPDAGSMCMMIFHLHPNFLPEVQLQNHLQLELGPKNIFCLKTCLYACSYLVYSYLSTCIQMYTAGGREVTKHHLLLNLAELIDDLTCSRINIGCI